MSYPTVLMVMDMQRDFCDPDGAYARHGFDIRLIEPIIPTIRRVMEAARARRIPIIATKLTVLTDLEGRAMGLGHLAQLRPWMAEEGFRAGTPGHDLIPALPEPDYVVRKWGYSALYSTELEKLLLALGARTLVFTGIATNGVVEGTARDAVMRDWHVITLSDAVASFSRALHEASLLNLANIGRVMTADEWLASLAMSG
ncbi:MAG: cysteine hydrolase [Dehalococcoidia bacterium]|nr:MAG: cysteine hydrolase [Dehalococcoidia bacterium]